MKENHIVDLLESCSLGSLSVAELETVRAHTAVCPECLLAYQAAQASLLLLQERGSVIVAPPPFFQTKVMAAIREQKLSPKRLGFLNVWQTARPAGRFNGSVRDDASGADLFQRSEPAIEPSDLASVNDSSPEWVVLDSDDAENEMTYSQALTVLYDPTMEAMDADGK